MSAVVYLRSSSAELVTSSLICSKTEVTPLKRKTIPRLDLTAATLLTRLTARVVQTLELAYTPIYLWTDSSIVYTWINNHPSKWKEYVHNRVCLIQETLPQAQWKLVPGQDNPADCASRGLTPIELSEHNLWWKGPSWLTQEKTFWPCQTPSLNWDEVGEARDKITTHLTRDSDKVPWELVNRYSNLSSSNHCYV